MAKLKLVPHLWFAKEAEEAARLYASIFPDSRVDRVSTIPADTPSGPAGTVKVVELTLFGQPVMALEAGPHDPFNDAISLLVRCESQAEIDRYWNALVESGARPVACGWITDKYGVRWQIAWDGVGRLMTDPDREKAARAMKVVLKQVKVDIAAIEAAARG
ncbi:MAG TPA: VOC family protein [Labilithrix sp.]|jgi:predicted 3-demethylubiquinone-9 3-methyltransferase (glyoxalase superfamily)